MNLSEGQQASTATAQATEEKLLCVAVLPKAGPRCTDDMLTFPLYWVQADTSTFIPGQVEDWEDCPSFPLGTMLEEILADPLLETIWFSPGSSRRSWGENFHSCGWRWFAEKQFLPGVTDNLARTVEEALALKGQTGIKVASGMGYLLADSRTRTERSVEEDGKYKLYHPLTDRFRIHDLTGIFSRFLKFPNVHAGQVHEPEVIPLDLSDKDLLALSRTRLLALTLPEMKAIRDHFADPQRQAQRKKEGLAAWPTDVELEVIAQTWSEHCKHKIFSAAITHSEGNKKQEINSLFKTYIQGPTFELMNKRQDLLSVFDDNSGVVRWNHDWAVCFKVETHNSPSALEPYGGALTGILGVNRDILGTGLGAKPIFNTDVLCFAYPSALLPKRPKLLPPESIMKGVRKGIQDGGNKSGIPTVNGAVCFHPGFRAKPLVFCGTGGILPVEVNGKTGFGKHTKVGDEIIMAGGRVGKDGIHGATFSSEALHEGSPVSAVQIGDPFTQKRLLDFVLAARDQDLITGITDNGAGGLSSSVGEMARLTGGATMELENIPLKYPGLADYEIVISESQERMTISTRNTAALKELAEKFNVEVTSVGNFTTDGYFRITRSGKVVGLLELSFLHDGVPKLQLESTWQPARPTNRIGSQTRDLEGMLMALLWHENVCSREPVIRQYDHEVQGGSVIKPLMGEEQCAPCDAAVLRPLLAEKAGLVVSNGLAPQLSEHDPYTMALCSVDEAVRNAVCVGADPKSLVLLDNFCWPDPVASADNPEGKMRLAQLVLTCQGLADAVRAYQAPLISGKDSMKNNFDDGEVKLAVPPTLLVSAMGKMADAELATSMEFKEGGDIIYVLAAGWLGFAGSLIASVSDWQATSLPGVDLTASAELYQKVHSCINKGYLRSCHDLSEGGLAVALAECSIGSGLGARLLTHRIATAANHGMDVDDPMLEAMMGRLDFALFAEGPARLLVTVSPADQEKFEKEIGGCCAIEIGKVSDGMDLEFVDSDRNTVFSVSVKELETAWRRLLPFDEEDEA